jgi:hypothetical protein
MGSTIGTRVGSIRIGTQVTGRRANVLAKSCSLDTLIEVDASLVGITLVTHLADATLSVVGHLGIGTAFECRADAGVN